MGATAWHYYVPYQADTDAALQHLRQQVFRAGNRQGDWTSLLQLTEMSEDEEEEYVADAAPLLREMYERLKREGYYGATKAKPTSPPQTIEELVERAAENGTHCILDIDHVATALEFGALTPLSEQQLQDLFGTAQPTRVQVEEWRRRIPSIDKPRLYDRWESISITVYKDGVPDELYFEGASGD